MIVRRLIVFSGFDAKVVERLRPRLEAQQADVVVTKLPGELDDTYFDLLLQRLATVVHPRLDDSNVRLVSILVSCLSKQEHLAQERGAFWPMLRRLAIDRSFARDVNKAGSLGDRIMQLFTSQPFLQTYDRVKPGADPILALPVRNIGTPRLGAALEDLYNIASLQPPKSLERYIHTLKGGRGLQVNGVAFKGCVNDPSHPVRRRSETLRCDLAGRFRLGFSLPSRFEFDVTCATGLRGKTFHLCDGTPLKIPASATHLNMRMNDDFDHP